jgi:hypothetical protein
MKCGLERGNKFILSEAFYDFRPMRFPPYRRITRFAPLCDDLPQTDRNSILAMYHLILDRWKAFPERRSTYFYNRGVTYQFLTSLHFKTPYQHVLQNKTSENEQRLEMEKLLLYDPKPVYPPPLEGLDAIWALFELEKGLHGSERS